MEQLVQISEKREPPPLRHPVVEEFVAEISNFWTRIGAVKNCISCHEGEFNCGSKAHPYQSHGCCPPDCAHLTPTGCIGKPLGCAVYSCEMYGTGRNQLHSKGFTETQWKQVQTLIRGIADSLYRSKAYDYKKHIPVQFFPAAYAREVNHTWTKENLAKLRAGTKKLKAFKFKGAVA